MKRITQLFLVVIIGMLGFWSCAQDVELIDRTQTRKIDKSIFTGEWFFRPTVVEVDFNQGMFFDGWEFATDRIRWDIQEDRLIAYRSFELLEGAETGNGSKEFYGNPLAVFKIESHFDLMRDYNEATGEQSNVLNENTTDRPWYERQYMRIDWSMNLAKDPYEFRSMLVAYAGPAYYVPDDEVDNPYRAEINANAINVVGNIFFETDFYTCYYAFFDPYWCGSHEAKIKYSFRKVQPSDYQPLHFPDNAVIYDDNGEPVRLCDFNTTTPDGTPHDVSSCEVTSIPVFERFGYFRTHRLAYDEEYGWLANNRIQLANRHNIWTKSVADDDFISKANKGAIDFFDNNLCKVGSNIKAGEVIPKACRPTGNITYYTNVEFPSDLYDAAQEVVDDWDTAFRNTVAGLRNVLVGSEIMTLDDESIDPIYVLEQNTCNIPFARAFAKNGYSETLREYGINKIIKGNLMRACSVLEWASNGQFQWQKQGDLRYSYINWVETPQNSGPLGYGPSSPDPVTGEIISATANIYGAAIDEYSAWAADIIQIMNGRLSIEDVYEGENIRQAMANLNIKTSPKKLNKAELSALWQETYQEVQKNRHLATVENAQHMVYRGISKMDRVANSAIEKELLVNDDLNRAMYGPEAYQPSTGIAEDVEYKSPMNFIQQDLFEHENVLRELRVAGVEFAEFFDDPAVAHVAYDLKDLTNWEDVYAEMRRRIFVGLTTHEVGHTLGLRHNFQGSFDPLNYHVDFWRFYDANTNQIAFEDANGEATRAHSYMYSSIMDYSARFYADDLKGIGPYDNAAIKFGYGGLVEVFNNPPIEINSVEYPYNLENIMLFYYDYNNIPKLLGEGWQQWDPSNIQWGWEQDWLEEQVMVSSPNIGNIWNRKDIDFKDLKADWTRFYMEKAEWFRNHPWDLENEYIKPPISHVPYSFCSDYRAGWLWYCQMWDHGGNMLETAQDRITRQEQYYAFSNFRRDRANFGQGRGIQNYMSRLLFRYMMPLWDNFNFWYWMMHGYAREDLPNGQLWHQAAREGINYLAKTILTPEPGKYCLDEDALDPFYRFSGRLNDTVNCDNGDLPLRIPVGIGKFHYTHWTDEHNYKPTYIGTFFDKYLAMWVMTYNQGYFYQNYSDQLDPGAFAYSYWKAEGMRDELLNLFGDMTLGVPNTYAWRIRNPGSASQEILSAPMFDIYDDWNELDYFLPKIEASSSWNMRHYATIFPMVRFNHMYDTRMDYSDWVRVCVVGSPDCYEIDGVENIDYVIFTDPMSNLTYQAPFNFIYKDAINGEGEKMGEARSIGTELLMNAQPYADAYTQAESLAYEAHNGTEVFVLTVEEQSKYGQTYFSDLDETEKQEVRQERLLNQTACANDLNKVVAVIDVVRLFGEITEF